MVAAAKKRIMRRTWVAKSLYLLLVTVTLAIPSLWPPGLAPRLLQKRLGVSKTVHAPGDILGFVTAKNLIFEIIAAMRFSRGQTARKPEQS